MLLTVGTSEAEFCGIRTQKSMHIFIVLWWAHWMYVLLVVRYNIYSEVQDECCDFLEPLY